MGSNPFGIDPDAVARVAGEVAAAQAAGHELCLVVGAGNIFRGLAAASQGFDRTSADYMGMLATVMNALAVQNGLEQIWRRHQGAVGDPDGATKVVMRALYSGGGRRGTWKRAASSCSPPAPATPISTTSTPPRRSPACRRDELRTRCSRVPARRRRLHDAGSEEGPGARRYEVRSSASNRVLADNLQGDGRQRGRALSATTISRSSSSTSASRAILRECWQGEGTATITLPGNEGEERWPMTRSPISTAGCTARSRP